VTFVQKSKKFQNKVSIQSDVCAVEFNV
jgi:hypothetical protein